MRTGFVDVLVLRMDHANLVRLPGDQATEDEDCPEIDVGDILRDARRP